MNQILATKTDNKKRKKPKMPGKSVSSDIAKVTKVFAIGLIIFGGCVIGTGSYSLYKEKETNNKTTINEMSKPVISVEAIEGDESTILLKTTSNIGIETVVYQWNDGKKTTLTGNGGKYLEQKVQIPSGSNVLNITVVDSQNQESTYSKKYELNSNIKLEAIGNGKIKIEYEGETEISYLTYRWDDQDENKIDINSKTIDKEIDTLNGKHTLTIIVVDVNNHTETKVQQTNGVSIPTIDIRFNEDKTSYIINVKDDVELKEVIITLDEYDSKKYGQKINGKEFQFEIALKEGSDNKMKVQVTNSDDQTAEKAVMFSK